VDVLKRIREVLSAETNDTQLDRFLSEVRDSLAGSSRLFLAYYGLTLGSVVTYHLVVYGGKTMISFSGVQVADTLLFRRVFLLFPAALLAATACVGYLRRLQREVFDFLTISRYPILGKTGLHELRLPADHILGLFMLRNEGGVVGKIISRLIAVLSTVAFVVAPTIYVISEATKNVRLFGWNDTLTLTTSIVSAVLSMCSLVVVGLAGRIKAEE
jgi:hypothetical protein